MFYSVKNNKNLNINMYIHIYMNDPFFWHLYQSNRCTIVSHVVFALPEKVIMLNLFNVLIWHLHIVFSKTSVLQSFFCICLYIIKDYKIFSSINILFFIIMSSKINGQNCQLCSIEANKKIEMDPEAVFLEVDVLL